MPLPTVLEIRELLECYGITDTLLSDAWITNKLMNVVVPHVQSYTRQSFEGTSQVTEYYSGNGDSILILNCRPIVSVDEIFLVTYNDVDTRLGISNVVAIKDEGILKSVGVFENYPYVSIFPKGINNIKITYTYGFASTPNDIKEAMKMLTAYHILVHVGARTGGGSVSVQGHSRSYGSLGKYTDIIKLLYRSAYSILGDYATGIVGS